MVSMIFLRSCMVVVVFSLFLVRLSSVSIEQEPLSCVALAPQRGGWFVKVSNNTFQGLMLDLDLGDGSSEKYEVAPLSEETVHFKPRSLRGVTIGETGNGLGTYISYGLSCNKVIIEYPSGSMISRHLYFEEGD